MSKSKGLNVGAKVPQFKAIDLHDEPFELVKALEKGPLVVIFYRGQWCPFCNKHLKALEKELDKIQETGAQVVAISPEKSEFLKRTAEKTKASFRLLHDEGYAISRLFDVITHPGKVEKFMVNTMLGAKLKTSNTDDSQRLPIPATFIINQKGEIVWRHFNPDYKKRSSTLDIIHNIPKKNE
jgi:peroxiredoxin